ncbi:MAG: hypothetical protein V4456_16570 [Bacteroidota bacterium]
MKSTLLKSFTLLALCLNFNALAQEKMTLFYNESGKGLDTKKKAIFYRKVTYDDHNKPVGFVEDFYMNNKPLAKGEASIIDKFDNTNSRWKGKVTTYNERGDISSESFYDEEGKLDGVQLFFGQNGIKEKQLEFSHGNPTKDYYLVYDKKGETSRYSYLTHLPMRLSTSDKTIVPVMLRKVIYQNDQPVQFYLIDGLTVAVKLSTKQLYGNYYEAYVTIENGTDNQFNFDPSYITASLDESGEVKEGEVLIFKDYDKKVKRKQAWTAAFSAFAEFAVATTAGYSSTTTNAYAKASNGRSVSVQAKSTSYNGAAQYAATQNAANNVSNLVDRQYEIRQTISEGYLKLNTIFPYSRLVGFINIKYHKADHILLNVPVNGKVYHFEL